jgi:glucosyl-3-phosphoglycerate phosphatase
MYLMRHGQSVFNLHYTGTLRDPGIIDALLTRRGRQQAAAAARGVATLALTRLVVSPYTRAIQTALLACRETSLDIELQPLIGEWGIESCNVGSPPGLLARRFPNIPSEHLPMRWWPQQPEPESDLIVRCQKFVDSARARTDFDTTLVICHWGVIRALTGLDVGNCALVHIDCGVVAHGFPENEFRHQNVQNNASEPISNEI